MKFNNVKKRITKKITARNAKPTLPNLELVAELKGSIFSFGKVKEQPFTNEFTLGEDFKIKGYQDDNEYSWNVYGNKLQIYNREGKISSEFLIDGDLSILSGKSLKFSDIEFELKRLSSEKTGKFDENLKIEDAFRIQNIVFPLTMVDRTTRRGLFYQGDEIVSFGQSNIIDGYSDFSAYINALSIAKWKKYTTTKDFYLKMTIKGKFELGVVNHWLKFKSKEMQKKGSDKVFKDLYVSDIDDIFKRNVMNFQSNNSEIERAVVKYNLEFDKPTEITIPANQVNEQALLSFFIKGNAEIFDAGWYSSIQFDKINPVNIIINTTTFQKEKYILKNLRNIKEQIVEFETKDRGLNQLGEGHLFVNVVDNGRTLDKEALDSDYVRIYGNPNTGGAGGFSRGMIESLNLKETGVYSATHVIFMDDDIEILPESFKRVYSLLSLIKEEYKDYFIEGGMMDSDNGVTQHEDTGFISKSKDIAYLSVKDTLNLSVLKDVLRNDLEYPVDNEYGAWWYCIVPMKYIHEKSMSLPIFYRGDDIEFSTRNKAKFITLNGIAVWHLPFYAKKSKSLENYLVPRNSFIDQAVNDFWKDAKILEKYLELYKKEIRMFNYNAADQVLDALDDYLRGPEYIASLKGIEPLLKEKKKDEKFSTDIPEKIKRNLHTVNDSWALYPGDYELFIETDNGHSLPQVVLNQDDDKLENVAIIDQNLADHPGKQFMKKRLVIFDTYNKAYTILERNQEKYEELEKRYHDLLNKYEKEGEEVARQYREQADNFHSAEFWKNYLKEQEEYFDKK